MARHAKKHPAWWWVTPILLLAVVFGGLHAHHPGAPQRPAATTPAYHVNLAPPTLPRPAQPRAVAYKVRAGDTLWGVAGARCGNPLDWPRLWHANMTMIHDPDRIFTWMVIRLDC